MTKTTTSKHALETANRLHPDQVQFWELNVLRTGQTVVSAASALERLPTRESVENSRFKSIMGFIVATLVVTILICRFTSYDNTATVLGLLSLLSGPMLLELYFRRKVSKISEAREYEMNALSRFVNDSEPILRYFVSAWPNKDEARHAALLFAKAVLLLEMSFKELRKQEKVSEAEIALHIARNADARESLKSFASSARRFGLLGDDAVEHAYESARKTLFV